MKKIQKSFQLLTALLCLSAIPLRGNNAKGDIETIGNRRVARRSIISQGMEARMGKAAAARLEHSVKLVQDEALNEYVNRVGKKVAANSDLKMPVRVRIIDSPTFDASSLPGGFLYVTSGFLMSLDSEAQLAAALAHEIAHLAARHGTSQATRRILMDGVGFLPFGTAYVISTDIAQPSIPLALAKFSRRQELEADFLGVQYLYKSGYDPNAFVTLLEKSSNIEASASAGSRKHRFHASHPQIEERIRRARKEIWNILPEREYAAGSNAEFASVKNRLLAGRDNLETVAGSIAARETRNSEGESSVRGTEPSAGLNSEPVSETEADRKPIDFTPPVLEHNGQPGPRPAR